MAGPVSNAFLCGLLCRSQGPLSDFIPCIMGLTTQDPYILKEHTELYKILKFCVNWALMSRYAGADENGRFDEILSN